MTMDAARSLAVQLVLSPAHRVGAQIETVGSKEPLEKHPQPRAPSPEKLFDSGPDSRPKKLFHLGSIWVPDLGPEKSYTIQAQDGWWTQMCRLKRWPPKSPWRNIHSQEPRAPKSCSLRAPIRAPKSCSIRVPDSGPEKSYTIRAPKRWLVDTNVQIETVASKEPLEKHPQPRAPGHEKLFDSGPVRAPKSCSFRVPTRARKVV